MQAFAFDTFGSVLTESTGTIRTHLTGSMVSLAVPVVFVGMFIASKLLTWIIYCIVKQFIKKAAKRAEAHNAAVDAVKAVQGAEMPDAEVMNQNPIPQPSFNNPEQDEDFGTFGIFPKEEEKPLDEQETVASADFMAESSTEIIETAVTDADTDSQTEEGNTAEISDGFEVIAASAEDGFEALAKSKKTEKVVDPEPVKEKVMKRKRSLSILLMKKSALSSVLGGILGVFIWLYSSAIIFSPISAIVNILAEEKVAEPLVDLATTFMDADANELMEAAFEENPKPLTGITRDFEITSDFSIRPEDFVEAINDHKETVIYYIYKYSGSLGFSSFIYNKLTPVDVREIGLDNKGITIYNFPDTLRCYMGLIPPADRLVDYLGSGKGFGIEMLDRLEEFFGFVLQDRDKGEILTSADKTALINSLVTRLNVELSEVPELQKAGVTIEPFEDPDSARKGLRDMFDLVRSLIRAGVF